MLHTSTWSLPSGGSSEGDTVVSIVELLYEDFQTETRLEDCALMEMN